MAKTHERYANNEIFSKIIISFYWIQNIFGVDKIAKKYVFKHVIFNNKTCRFPILAREIQYLGTCDRGGEQYECDWWSCCVRANNERRLLFYVTTRYDSYECISVGCRLSNTRTFFFYRFSDVVYESHARLITFAEHTGATRIVHFGWGGLILTLFISSKIFFFRCRTRL